MEGLVTMSNKELDRMLVLDRVLERALTQRAAGEMLGLSDRQIRRMLRAYEVSGAPALVSKRRGKPSNRKLPEDLHATAIELVRTRYADFGPTLAAEKLAEVHGVCVSVETLRKWMRDAGLWLSRLERRRRPQPPRHRRECLGELIQIDGSDHEWFEGRGPRCTLLVFVDDATGRIMQLYFARSESTFDYFAAMTQYLRRHGRPVAFYSDKASIFRVNHSAPKGGDGITQLGRAMQSLNIDLICANTPAAKGRVERAHQTLQDRLVKELRLRNIVDRDAANAYAPEFAESYNQRFARVPRNDHDAHRPLQPQNDLDRIFTLHDKRRLTSNLTLHYNRALYVVDVEAPGVEHARGKLVDVRELENGEVVIEHNGTVLPRPNLPEGIPRPTRRDRREQAPRSHAEHHPRAPRVTGKEDAQFAHTHSARRGLSAAQHGRERSAAPTSKEEAVSPRPILRTGA